MKPRNVIPRVFLSVLILLAMVTVVQAQELEEVPASYILEKIQAGEEISLDHVHVIGALDLSNIELEPIYIRSEHQINSLGLKEELKPVESPMTITNSVFENNINFQNAWFRNPINFQSTTFSREVNFRGAIFDYYVFFNDARFEDDAYFDRATFVYYTDFDNANFDADIGFQNAIFKCDAHFYNATFDGVTDFKFASFGDYTCFNFANFGSIAEFKSANFRERASFMCATFGDDAYFRHTHFDGNTNFNSVNFSGNAEFIFTEFDKVDFSNVVFSKLFLLQDADFESMKVDWIDLKDALVFDGPTYIKLIKNFGELEQFEDADNAYYQYRRLSQADKEWSHSKLEDIFMWFTCGYGVRPWRAAVWAVAIILIFTPIYHWRGGIKRLKENNEDCKQDVSFYDALYFSMTTFTTIGYGDWYPKDRYRMAAVMIEGLVGWLLLALFLVTLANVMIRP